MEQKRQRKRFHQEEWVRFAIAVLGGGSRVVPQLDYLREAVACSGHADPERYQHIHQIPGLKKATDFLVEQGLIARVEIEGGGYGYQRTDKAVPTKLISVTSAEVIKTPRKRQKSRGDAGTNSGFAGILEVMMRVCSVLKHQDKNRQKAITRATEQMARMEKRFELCEKEMKELRAAGISATGDGAEGAYLERAQRKILALLDQIEQEEA